MSELKYIHLTSNDKSSFPRFGRKKLDFEVNLPQWISLSGSWAVSLIDFHISTFTPGGVLHICSDLCEDSIVNDTKIPLLKRCFFPSSNTFYWSDGGTHPIKVSKTEFNTVRIFILDEQFNPISDTGETIICSLCLLRVE